MRSGAAEQVSTPRRYDSLMLDVAIVGGGPAGLAADAGSKAAHAINRALTVELVGEGLL